MLSESQQLRRLRSRSGNRHRLRHDLEYERYKRDVEREQKNTTKLTQECSSSMPPGLISCSDDSKAASGQSNSPLGARKVRFSTVIRVCLVPCRADFRSDFYLLFWEREDYQAFKEDAVRELRAHWTQHHTSVKEAIFDMYQPSPDCVDHMNMMTELAPLPSPAKRLLAHVDSMGVMANLAKSSAASVANPTPSSPGSSAENSPECSPECSPEKSSGSSAGSGTSSRGGRSKADQNGSQDTESTGIYAPITAEVTENSDSAPSTRSQQDLPYIAPTTRKDTTTGSSFEESNIQDDRGLRTSGGGGLTLLLTSGGANPVTPLRRDTMSSEGSSENKEQTVVDASALFTPEMSCAPYRSRPESPFRSSPLPISTSPVPVPVPDAAAIAGSAGGGSVRIILLEESPSTSVSSFESPILIC